MLFLEVLSTRWLPWMPYIPRRIEFIKQLISKYPALDSISQSMSWEVNFIPSQIGLFFLVPLNYLFSIWVFVIVKSLIALLWGGLGLMATPGIGTNSFHPMGFLLAMMHPTQYFMTLNAFLAWVCKFVVMRYFGASGYKRAIPFFLGIAVGAQVVMVLNVLLQSLTGI